MQDPHVERSTRTRDRIRSYAKRAAVLAFWCALLLGNRAYAQVIFERVSLVQSAGYGEYFAGSRMAALGHADLAGTRGAEAAWSNPGPLFQPRDGATLEFGLNRDFGRSFSADRGDFSGVAADVQRGRVRASLATRGYRLEGIPLRTAFDPDGTTTTASRREVALGVSGDLGALLTLGRPWGWSLGLAARWVELGVANDDASMLAFDLGTSGAWQHSGPLARVGIEAALVALNLAGSSADFSGREVEIPQLLRSAITFSAAMRRGSADQSYARLRVSGATTHDLRGRDEVTAHAGVELEFVDLLALRVGRNDRLYGGTNSFGLGLHHEIDASFELAVDWARESADSVTRSIEFDVWGMRAGWSF